MEQCVEQAVELVRRNALTEMDGRDLARCLALEASNQNHAYTVSMERGAIYGPRHLRSTYLLCVFASLECPGIDLGIYSIANVTVTKLL